MISGRAPKWWLRSDHVGYLWDINNASKFIRTGEKRSKYILANQWLRVNMGLKNSWRVIGGLTCQAHWLSAPGHTATRQSSRESQEW